MMTTLFSQKLPSLQLAWDATSLSALSRCPRYYDLAVRQGWRAPGESTHLDFGVMAHHALEVYDRLRFTGAPHDEAQLAALQDVITASITREEDGGWKPWGGKYLQMWRCTGTEPYGKKGKSGGKLKCPNAKAHVWWPGHGPQVCPECFSPIASEERWLSDNPEKNRHTLVRTVVWWTEELKDSPLKTLPLPDGKPMVEVNFQIGLPWLFVQTKAKEIGTFVRFEGNENKENAERFVLCGYWDGGVAVGSENFVRERKTTKNGLDKKYWSGFSPSMQIDTYYLAVKFLPEIEGLNMRGVLVEAAQTLVGGSRFGWQQLYRTPAHNDEHLEQVEDLLRDAVRYAQEGKWPMRKSQCPFCPMKSVCKLEPGKRQMFLEANFVQKVWNPLEER